LARVIFHEASQLPTPRAILFDWDNTLVENWLTVQAALNAVLTAAGKTPLDLDQVKFQARHSARTIFPELFGEAWQDARATFLTYFRAHHLAGLSIMDGAEALIEAFREMSLPLAIVSNKEGDVLRREIDHLGWNAHFAAVIGARDAAADKPDPAPVHLALDRLGLAAGPDIWLVGDTDIDMRTACAAGVSPVLVGPGPADRDLLIGAEPVLRCKNCIDLMGFVRGERLPICQG
jgi:phosphoglycolate phosphatase